MNKTLTFFAVLLFTICFCSAKAQVWNPVGVGANNAVNAIVVDSINNKLYAGGSFTKMDGVNASSIAVYDGSTWKSLGSGIIGTVYAIFVDPSNGYIYAGGDFSLAGGKTAKNMAVWDGSVWTGLSGGLNGIVYAVTKYKGAIYAGGAFTTFTHTNKNYNAKYVAKFNGTTWDSVGTNGVDGLVNALALVNNTLYAGGKFTKAASIKAKYLAKWDGTAWDSVGSNGVNAEVTALANLKDTLYVGGNFTTVGSTSAASVAKWDGVTWSAFGSGLKASVKAFANYNGKVQAAGTFTLSGNSDTLNYIGEWDGASWNSLGSGFKNSVNALAVYDSVLYAGGKFTQLSGSCSLLHNYIAAWGTVKPKASFTSNIKAICANRAITFTDKSSCSTTSRKWIFNGGSPSTATVESPVVTYSANGVYDVKLVVTNQYGSDSITSSNYITIADPAFNTAFMNNKKYVCAGINDSVTIKSVPTNYTFYVQPTDGYRKFPTMISFGPSNTTLYAISYTNTPDGCVNSTQLIVVVKPQPAKPVMSRIGSTDTLISSYKSAKGNQWYRGTPAPNPNMNPGAPVIVTGATNYKFLMTVPGVGYSVTYTDSLGCRNESGIFIPPYLVGLAERTNLIQSMNVFPNPSSNGKFQLSFEGAESADYFLELINVLGEKVYAEHLGHFSGKYTKQLDLSELSNGIYLLSVKSGNSHAVKRVIVQ
jgi:PKD repeat protein